MKQKKKRKKKKETLFTSISIKLNFLAFGVICRGLMRSREWKGHQTIYSHKSLITVLGVVVCTSINCSSGKKEKKRVRLYSALLHFLGMNKDQKEK